MIKNFLKQAPKEKITYDTFHKWSGLSNLEASGNWMKNIRELIDYKKDKRGIAGKNYTNPFKKNK